MRRSDQIAELDGVLIQTIARVVLRPMTEFSGPAVPDDEAVDALHQAAHAECFIARSVRTDVSTRGRWRHLR